MDQLEFFVRCAGGFESLLTDELTALKIKRIRPLKGGVAFFGSVIDAYRVCLWSRVASRVLLILTRGAASDGDALYETVKSIAWEDQVNPGSTIAVYARGVNDKLKNTQFSALKAKDALCDRLRDVQGERPSVKTERPDVLVDLSLRKDRVTVALDFSGEPLHRRAYRRQGIQSVAPLKENLAAAIVLSAGWMQTAKKGGVFLDPMCGSGTLAIEAAMIAGDIAPGILRDYWGFIGWKQHDEELWNTLIDEADDRADKGRAAIGILLASDNDEKSVELARENARRVNLNDVISFEVCEASQAPKVFAQKIPKMSEISEGLIALNPPYGTRLGSQGDLAGVYESLTACVNLLPQEWELAVITPDEDIDLSLRRTPYRKTPFYNGKIETQVRQYKLAESNEVKILVAPLSGEGERTLSVFDKNSEQFAARLRKVAKERKKWAKKNGISCYRIYDADLPDYSVAIDIYEGAQKFEGNTYLHIAEYQAPKEIEEEKARRRFDDVLTIAPVILGIDPAHTFSKVRKREKGGQQYGDTASHFIVRTKEDGYLIQLDLRAYLDTGIFLDHRITRHLIGEMASGKRFLNLFAYTGVATVHAAGGKATETTTLDMSHTYIDWAQRNMELNGFNGPEHRYVKADVMTWIDQAIASKQQYDLIFVDPPTFSNSKSMGEVTWSVQRDHADLLAKMKELLSKDGSIVFSCNLRKFKLDTAALEAAGYKITDITEQTIPQDFARNKRIHSCFILNL